MINLRQNADGTLRLFDELAAADVLRLGGPASASASAPRYHGSQWVKVPLAAATGGGGILSVANPFGIDVLVGHFIVDVTTKSTGAANADFGYTATNATTSSDTLLDGVDIGTAAGVFDNIENQGTNGTSRLKWLTGKWLTGTASADPAGLVGNVYIEVLIP